MIIQSLGDHLKSSDLIDSYRVEYFGINDANPNFASAQLWVVIMQSGGAAVDPVFGTPIFRVLVGGSQSNKVANYNKTQELISWINTNNDNNGEIGGIVVQSDLTGPFNLENGRHFYEITLQVTHWRDL